MNRILKTYFGLITFFLFALITKGQSESVIKVDTVINSLIQCKDYKVDSVKSSFKNEIIVLEKELQDTLKLVEIAYSERADTFKIQKEYVEDSIEQITNNFFRSFGCLMKDLLLFEDSKLTKLYDKRNKLQSRIDVIMLQAKVRMDTLEANFNERVSNLKQKEEGIIHEIEREYDLKIQNLDES